MRTPTSRINMNHLNAPAFAGNSLIATLALHDGSTTTRSASNMPLDKFMIELSQQGLTVLSIDQHQRRERREAESTTTFPILQFSHEVLSLLEAGLNLGETIRTLWEKENNAGLSITGAISGSVLNQAAEKAGGMTRGFGRRKNEGSSVTDITKINTYEGWLYVAVVMDLYSRAVVG